MGAHREKQGLAVGKTEGHFVIHPQYSVGSCVNPCRSELAREKLKDAAYIQDARVIVDVLREQARSYKGAFASVTGDRNPAPS